MLRKVIDTRRHLKHAAERYSDAAKELTAWAVIVDKVRWRSFAEVRASFPDADEAHGFVVFDVSIIATNIYALADRFSVPASAFIESAHLNSQRSA